MKERERTCCFTGHRIIPAQVVPQLKAELAQTVTQLIDQGVTQFVTGGALGFDTMAAEEVLRQRKAHPDIRLHLMKRPDALPKDRPAGGRGDLPGGGVL